MPDAPKVKISVGELADRVTILRVKVERLDYPKKQIAQRELAEIDLLGIYDIPPSLVAQLARINAELWDIEDEKRQLEAAHDYRASWRALSRSVSALNDARAKIKRMISESCPTSVEEVKSHVGC